MQDILMVTLCDHRIQNYQLKIDGKQRGEYTATFPVEPIQSRGAIFIRSWEDEQKYLKSLKSFEYAQSHIFYNGSGAQRWDTPISGANAKIGIGGFAFISPRTIKFDVLPGEYRTVDPNPDLVPQNIYLVDFYCDSKNCPRCGGKNFVVDLAVLDTGSFAYVTGRDKIKQRVVKALLQPIRSCVSDYSFGSELNYMVGKVITDDLRIVMQATISDAVRNLIQNQPEDYLPEERIYALTGITIEAAPFAADAFFVKVIVQSEAGETIDCSVAFKLRS